MRGKIVVKGDGSRHLVVRTFAHAAKGRMLGLLSLDGEASEAAPDSVSVLREPSDGGNGSLLRVLLANRKAQESGGGGLSLRCNTMFKAFQFRPLVKFQGEARGNLLIADETGIGKTVEAGYILAEEYVAGRANRVLLMVKKRSLRKWITEMRDFFGLIFEVASHKRITECVNDPSKTFHLICTHDVGRNTSGWWDELDGSLDVLVIDEIHRHINPEGTLRRPMAEALSGVSDSVLGLTATPVRRNAEDLFRILEVVCPGLTDGLDIDEEMGLLALTNTLSRALETEDRTESSRLCTELTRIVPASVSSDARYPTDLISADPPWDPARIHEAVRFLRGIPRVSPHITRARGRDPEIDEYTPRSVHPTHWIRPQGDEAAIIAALDDLLRRAFYHIHRQQLASCRPAMLELMLNGSEGLRSFHRNVATLTRFNAPAQRAVSGSVEAECDAIARRLRAMRRDDDAKFEELVGLLADLRADPTVTKAVIFTHFIPSFSYLRDRLESTDMFSEDVRLICAGPNEDDDTLEGVNDALEATEGFAVLLTTDRMSESVDLHAANCVINYDLPYNPQDLQQRIGRVDRIIQQADVIHVHNFAVRGTVDEAIMDRIVQRSRIFEAVVGGMEAVAEEMESTGHRRGEVEEVIGSIEEQLIKSSLMEGEAFRFVDRVFDKRIRAARISQSPFMSREHLVLLEAFERLRPGAGHSWDSSSGVLGLAVDYTLAEAIVNMLGNAHGIGPEMMAELSEAARCGTLEIRFGGSDATMGPAHPFNRWVTTMLSSIEGMEGASMERAAMDPPGTLSLVRILGSRVTESVWLSSDNRTVDDWMESIEAMAESGSVTACDGAPGRLAGDSRIVALVDRDMAEHRRLHGARIRKLYARMRWLEDNPTIPRADEKLETVRSRIARLEDEPDPPAARAGLLHEFEAQGA